MDNLSDDIINYKMGRLNPSQMHALEKRALDDPFLAEALEGIDNLSDNELAHDISALNKKIGRKKNTVLFTPLRLAAGVLLLISSVFIIYQLIPKPERIARLEVENEKPRVESQNLKEKGEEPKAESQKGKEENEQQKFENKKLKAEDEKGLEKSKNQAAEISQPAPALDLASTESLHEAKPDGDLENAQAEEKVKELTDASPIAAGAQPAAVDRKKSFAQNNAKRSAPQSLKGIAIRSVSGQVSTDDGIPVPGATVADGTSTSTTTDLNGNYSIPIEADKSSLTFSFSGLQQVHVEIPTIDHVDVRMKDDSSELSVIIVTSASVTAARDQAAIRFAEPGGGKRTYDDYLKTNLRYPQDSLSKNIKGTVDITFTVSEEGGLLNFSTIKKLGYGCEEEIIRLVKEGPKWNPTTENGVPIKSVVKLQVQFDPVRFRK